MKPVAAPSPPLFHTLLSLGDDRCFKQSNAFQNSSSLRFGKNDHLETHLKFVFEEVKTSDGHDPQARAKATPRVSSQQSHN